MSLAELIPSVNSLPRVDKLRLLQLLVNALAEEEGISRQSSRSKPRTEYAPNTLHNTVIKYDQPFEPVAENDWESLT